MKRIHEKNTYLEIRTQEPFRQTYVQLNCLKKHFRTSPPYSTRQSYIYIALISPTIASHTATATAAEDKEKDEEKKNTHTHTTFRQLPALVSRLTFRKDSKGGGGDGVCRSYSRLCMHVRGRRRRAARIMARHTYRLRLYLK